MIIMSSERTSGSKRSTKILFSVAAAEQETEQALQSTLTPPNEPLTLEELREMKGQPVWTVTTGLDGSGRWELVCDVDYEDVLEMASCVDGLYAIEMDTYGSTWTAYRRPPEGEEEN
jgi:hypothetical protein